tara:strand:- start:529 stop:918 length:390 start_codon:yes stop_codon:yes gene_type:complete
LKNNDIKIGSNKSFGIVFFIVFLIIALYPMLKGQDLRLWSLIISFIFLILGMINSSILTPLNKIWFKFGILLGNIISPIVMAIVFFGVVLPTGIVMKILRKDLIALKKNNKNTYWIEKKSQMTSMKNQF